MEINNINLLEKSKFIQKNNKSKFESIKFYNNKTFYL